MAVEDCKEFATLEMAADRQQLVIAQGCQTYSQYADMIYANPAKSEENLDVITTVNYSYGKGTLGMLRSLVTIDDDGRHVPVDFYRIIRDLNNNWLNSWRDVFYGVMGIDGNPQLHPYAEPTVIGADCARADDCGAPNANVCVDPGDGRTQCGGVALGALACPSGTHYLELASGSVITSGACFADAQPSERVHGVAEASADARAILDLVNTAPVERLDVDVALDARAAKNIVEHRLGLDGEAGTADDDPFDSLAELDSVSWVGPDAFAKLLEYLTAPE